MVRVRRALWLIPVLAIALASPSTASSQFRPVLPHDDLNMEISDDFGRFIKGRVHMGVDLFSPQGTPVLAVADGVVKVAKWDERPGWYIAIVHDNGWRSLYLHLDGAEPRWERDRRGAETAFAPGIQWGTEVRAGDVIGFVGNSGNAERGPAHTHFELTFRGKPIDPYPYVAAALLAAQIESAIDDGSSPYR